MTIVVKKECIRSIDIDGRNAFNPNLNSDLTQILKDQVLSVSFVSTLSNDEILRVQADVGIAWGDLRSLELDGVPDYKRIMLKSPLVKKFITHESWAQLLPVVYSAGRTCPWQVPFRALPALRYWFVKANPCLDVDYQGDGGEDLDINDTSLVSGANLR